jgi:putative ABC transport system ATP-binding protein
MLVQMHSVGKVYNSNGMAKGVGLGIREGDFVSITGESGSGKSTLLSIIGGIAPPTSGEVLVDKIPIYELPAERLADFRREYIGFVFQQFHLIPYLNALENVMLPLCITGEKEMEPRALGALEKVGLKEKARRLPSELSGGEQQRVAIARALVNEPPIILADEPTGNLDTKTGEEIFHLFKELHHAGETVIIVTHNPALAKRTGLTVKMQDGTVLSVKDNHK